MMLPDPFALHRTLLYLVLIEKGQAKLCHVTPLFNQLAHSRLLKQTMKELLVPN
jgi:hypothetical protein